MASFSCVDSINGFLSTPYTSWSVVVAGIAVAILGILAIAYALLSIIGNRQSKTWVKIKVYDTLMSLALIMVFAMFSTMLCTFPVGEYSTVNLVPSSCNINSSSANNLYSLSMCDLYSFNNDVVALTSTVAFLGTVMAVVPTINIKLQAPIKGIKGVVASFSIKLAATAADKFVSFLSKGMVFVFLLNQVQLLLLGLAPLLFAMLISLGLISRMFGVTRSFGGAMIAFGLGLGFVYPLTVSITYGFVASALAASGFTGPLNTVIQGVIMPFFKIFAFSALGIFGIPSEALTFTSAINDFLLGGGLIATGTLFIPLINFTIVNSFIVDFSRSIGEKMDFFSLLTHIV